MKVQSNHFIAEEENNLQLEKHPHKESSHASSYLHIPQISLTFARKLVKLPQMGINASVLEDPVYRKEK